MDAQISERSGIERSTVAIWESKAKLKLIALPFINSYENPCGFVQVLTEKWIEMQNNSDIDPIGLELVEYMSKEIAADFPSNNDYIKIANFVNYLLNVYDKTKDADGIIYPSVKAEGDGFNVALKTDSFEKKFYFVKASLCYLVKRNDKSSVSTISDASTLGFNSLHTRCFSREIVHIELNAYIAVKIQSFEKFPLKLVRIIPKSR